MKRVWSIYGLIQINTEENGYSEINYDGQTTPVLKAPEDINYGWKHLTAIYSDEFKEVYLGTLRRTLLYMGAKVYINCPCVFVDSKDKTIELKADLFYHNRRIPTSVGSFYHHNENLTVAGVTIQNGYAHETYNIPSDLEVKDRDEYTFKLFADIDHQLSPALNSGYIYVVDTPSNKTRLSVDVYTIIANQGETSKLVARVHHKNYQDYIKYPTDLPTIGEGYAEFYIDGIRVELPDGKYKFDVNSSGFVTAPFQVTQDKGTHNILVNYYPDAPAAKSQYVKTGGCGTLYVGDDPDKTELTITSNRCTFIGNTSKTLTFTTEENLKGKISLYIDMEPVKLLNSDDDEYSLTVDGRNSFELSFDTLERPTNPDYRWNFTGYHNLSLKYSVDDGDFVPVDFWYYLDDLFIQRETSIEIFGEEDNNEILSDGESVYVGNNLYYMDGTTYRWYSPQNRPKNTTIGDELIIKVNDVENPDKKVNEGFVKVTFITRYNKTLEENLNGQ